MIKIQESGEMYLETILILSKSQTKVRAIDVAEYMGFSRASVSRGLSILKNENYLDSDEKGYLNLTDKGLKVAQDIYERHLVLTELLVKLGVDAKTAEADACKMEHDISEDTFQMFKKMLNDLK